MSLKKRLIPLTGVLLGAGGLLMAQVAPTSVFQLDGNAASSGLTNCSYDVGNTNCDYWNLLNAAGGASVTLNQSPPGADGSHWLARAFINGTTATESFTTGGSKDPNLLSQWAYSTSPTPNKDTLNAGYAAGYVRNGDFLLLFGADRVSPNGDANIGIWFFQQSITLNGSGGFNGSHTQHDLFVISAFTGGGGTSTITVLEWDQPGQPAGNPGCPAGVKNPQPGDCADSNLRLIAAPTNVCGTSPYCAITNATTTNSSWDGSLITPTFFEGGIDVTYALSQVGVTNLPCFGSFLMETRSSQSTSAVLKDFVLGGFNLCGMSISKVCSGPGTLNAGQNTIRYTFGSTNATPMVIHNTGIGTLSNVTIVDSLPTGATGAAFQATAPFPTQAQALAASLSAVGTTACPTGSPAGAACADVGSIPAGNYVKWTVAFNLGSLSASNSAIASGATASGLQPGACTDSGTVCSTSSGDSCSGSVSNTVTITKTCGIPAGYPIPGGGGNELAAVQGTQLFASGGQVSVKVNFSGTITNSGDTTLSSISVTDVPGATMNITWPGTAGTLAPGGQATYSGTYVPSSISSGNGTTAGRYGFTDEIYVTGAKATLGSDPAAKTACTSISGAPAGAQSCDGKTCNICFGDTSTTVGGLCTAPF